MQLANPVAWGRPVGFTPRGPVVWPEWIVAELVSLGPETSFNAELTDVLPRLRRFSLTLTRSSADADDLVQMTCERALTNAAKRKADQPLLPWLYTMARNLHRSELRKKQVRLGAGIVDAQDASELIDTTTGETAARAAQMIRAVMRLPEGMATVLLLVAVEGQSYADTADILDIPIGTVMSRVARARAQLRHELKMESA